MNSESFPRFWWSLLILLFFASLWTVGAGMLWYIGIPEFVLWNVLMIVIFIVTIFASGTFLKPDTMILSTFAGSIDGLDGGAQDMSDRGFLGSHLVINFPPILAKGYILPIPGFNIPMKPINALTGRVKARGDGSNEIEPEAPVTGIIEITMELPRDLRIMQAFARKIDLLSEKRLNLAESKPIPFYEQNYNTGEVKPTDRNCFWIVEVLQKVFQPAVDEAFSQTVREFSFSDALATDSTLETKFKEKLFKNDNIIKRAGLLTADENKKFMFDVNLVDIAPSDPATVKAISSEARESYIAKGVIKKADGEARAIERKSLAVVKPGGHVVLASETLRAIGESGKATIVATSDVLSAVAGSLLKAAPTPPQEQTNDPPKT